MAPCGVSSILTRGLVSVAPLVSCHLLLFVLGGMNPPAEYLVGAFFIPRIPALNSAFAARTPALESLFRYLSSLDVPVLRLEVFC